jgi:glycosyltransferase involved in cell wall biosynthesis
MQLDLRIGIVADYYPSKKAPNHNPFIRDVVEQLRSAGVTVTLIKHLINLPAMSLEILMRSRQLDLLDAQFIAPAGIVTAFSPRFAPFVVTVHRWDIIEFPHRWPFGKATTATLSAASGIITVSHAIRSEVAKFAPADTPIAIIPNAVDTSRFTPQVPFDSLKRELGIPDMDRVILTVGHLIPRKGHHWLLRGMVKVLGSYPDCTLVIVGDGELREGMKALGGELRLGNKLRLTGAVEAAVLPSFYSMCDVFVMPSLSEGHCVSILEAMSSGKPVIASDLPANAESIISDKNGYLIPPRDHEALAASILHILMNDTVRKELGQYSRKRALSKFSWTQRTKHLVDFYKSVLGSN